MDGWMFDGSVCVTSFGETFLMKVLPLLLCHVCLVAVDRIVGCVSARIYQKEIF